MPRVALDLEQKDDLAVIKSDGWRVAQGLEPGEPNQGLVAEKRGSDARLPDYDDSGWESGSDFQKRYSVGLTFAWYRLRFTMPETVKGQDVTTCRVWFETNVDNYGEVFIDGKIDRNIGVVTGNNTPQARPGGRAGRAGQGARHRRAGRQRPAGRAGRRHLHALRHPGLRVPAARLGASAQLPLNRRSGRSRGDQTNPNGGFAMATQSFAGTVNAPDFPDSVEWINTDRPLSMAELRGKVVILDFWTYC